MGNYLGAACTRFFDYPLKPRPFCVYRFEDHTLTGEFLGNTTEENTDDLTETDYQKLSNEFYKKLLGRRRRAQANRSKKDDAILKTFPGWNETTVSYLHSLYLTFCDGNHKLLNYKGFECILECLGDENSAETRRNRFQFIDEDKDGFINYVDFLHIVYNFETIQRDIAAETAGVLGRLCVKVAEKTRFVNTLSIGKQLEYGLF